MGFIGGGAILRRGDMVHGVTTAATLWLVTIIGLCLGGGQLGLGIAALGLALLVLWGFKWLEARLTLVRTACLDVVVVGADGPTEDELLTFILRAGCKVTSWVVTTKREPTGFRRTIRSEIRWHGRSGDLRSPDFVDQITRLSGVKAVRWESNL